MSGHKRTTVTISQEEYSRLYEAENRNFFATLTIPDQTFNQTIQNSQEQLIGDFHKIAERQNNYEKVIDQYQDKIRDIEVTTTQSLYDQQVEFYNQLLGMSDLVWSNASDLIQIQSQEFESNVIAQNQHLHAQIQSLDQKMNWFNHREEKLFTASTEWMNDVAVLVNFIYTNYPRELVDQYMIPNLHNQINLAQRNIEDGFYEAGLTINQNLFISLSHVRLELENQLTLRSALLQMVSDNLALLSSRCLDCQHVNAIDLDGEEMPELLDVNYWTDNALSILKEKIEKSSKQIVGTGFSLNVTELDLILNQDIPDLSGRLVEIVNLARRNALNSQLRYNVAQMVMLSVIHQGYQPKAGAYSDEDYRQGYLAKAVSPDGSEIVVKVDPGVGLQNELQLINSHPGVINEVEMRKRSVEIIQSLEAYGLNIGNIEQISDPQTNKHQPLPTKPQNKIKEKALRGSLHG